MTKLAILFFSFLIILSRVVAFYIGAQRQRKKKIKMVSDSEIPFVSVIIPARNEEHNIRNCIESVYQNNYPKNKFEIIVVNDRSEDNTSNIIEECKKEFSNLKVVTVTEATKHHNLKGKPGALQEGAETASGEIFLFTDADCIVGNNWLSKIVAAFNNQKVGIVPSFTTIKAHNFFERLQGVEWIYMHTLASGGIGLNIPLGCFGNNLSIRKNVFWELGGYEKIKFSVTEDLALLQAVFDVGWKIHYLFSSESVVTTLPCKTLKSYIQQHHRWTVGGLDLGWRATVFIFTSLWFWIGLIVSLVFADWFWFSLIAAGRIFGDWLLIKTSINILSKNNKKNFSKLITPYLIFIILIELVAPFFLLNRKVKWKNQIFHNKKK